MPKKAKRRLKPADDPNYLKPADDPNYLKPADDPSYLKPADEEWICPNCDAELPNEAANFCSNCGISVAEEEAATFCWDCATELPEEAANFCPNCGAEQDPGATHEEPIQPPDEVPAREGPEGPSRRPEGPSRRPEGPSRRPEGPSR
jgi:hypothetical protein